MRSNVLNVIYVKAKKEAFMTMLNRLFAKLFMMFSLMVVPLSAGAMETDLETLKKQAKGEEVFFNAWGGDEKINAYIRWTGDQVKALYDIDLTHVKLTDTAAAVSRILAEKTAKRDTDGSVDLLWVNGENFAAMMRADLLQDHDWVTSLPNWRYTDEAELPAIALDFAVPTKGRESPWGRAQLVFFHDTAYLAEPPRNAQALKAYINQNPGRFTYPQPPDFIGVSFLKQLLIELNDSHEALYRPVDEADFDTITAPLWAYLDEIDSHLWRGGQAYPQNYPAQRQLMADGEIDIYIAFNPADASSAIARGELSETVRSYIHEGGTLANVHFLAIPFNSGSSAAAKLVADFMLSPQAQLAKANPDIWGDPSVLSLKRLPASYQTEFENLPKGVATLSPAALAKTLAEPHPSWVPRLEDEWIARFGSGN